MKCPVCNSSMIVVEREKIELDHCVSCRGIWFDAGELELLLDDVTGRSTRSTLEVMLNRPAVDCGEKARKCPICRKNMQKVDISRGNSLVVDVCRSGHGTWFDGGEIGRLINLLGIREEGEPKPLDNMLLFVAETFKAEPAIKKD